MCPMGQAPGKYLNASPQLKPCSDPLTWVLLLSPVKVKETAQRQRKAHAQTCRVEFRFKLGITRLYSLPPIHLHGTHQRCQA